MKIWLINHYAVPPHYYPLARPSLFAKNLIKMGHDVTIIAASTVHNSDLDMINDESRVKREVIDGIPYVFIKCRHYKGNGIDRVINILEFAIKLPRVCNTLDKPDAIVATSFDPLSCYQGVRYAKKHGIKAIAEIADLWPETLVEYAHLSRKNPIVSILRKIEHNIYAESDEIIFTGAGGYESIVDQGWEEDIPKTKAHYINNGIDLVQFDSNKKNYRTEDLDLDNPDFFKVIYTGSIRKVNNVGGILDIAKEVTNPKIVFLIWGDGDELPKLKQRINDEHISNVIFKGVVEKKFVPYIVSRADLNFAHNTASPLFKYGLSFNKIFDYLAAGKPIICDFPSNFNPIIMGGAGVSVESANPKDVAKQIESFADMVPVEYDRFCVAAKKAAKDYDFELLTQRLLSVITR